MLEYSHQSTSEDEHQFEVKSAETDFIGGQREPEPCRMKHTEEQTGCVYS